MKTIALLRRQVALETSYPDLIARQVQAGETAQPEVTTAQIALTQLRQALVNAEGQVNIAHVTLAAAIGVQDSVLAGKELTWQGIDEAPMPTSLPQRSVREATVANRLDVQRALEQYEAAQSNLQLEVAKQYPDIHLGPGYNYEEGAHFIALNLSSVLPLRNRNEGPIAEAEAQRKAAGSQLLATQSAVIAESDKALTQYAGAYAVLEEAQRSVAQLEEQQRAAEQLRDAGETDQLSVVAAELQTVLAERALADARHQAQLSLGLLEDALERPIAPGTAPALPKKAPR